MATGRVAPTATLLANGKVLVAGGATFSSTLDSAELYDALTGTFTATASMTNPRQYHTATLLPSGKVLLAGGCCSPGFPHILASAEIYDPATGQFIATGSMATPRQQHTSTLLPNGKVLVTGGLNGANVPLATAELYDPSIGTFSPTGSLAASRYGHTATLLPEGKVLIAGGTTYADEFTTLGTAELYDPATGEFTATGSMTIHRVYHTATLLPNGTVLVAGGGNEVTIEASAELYDPATGQFTATGSLTIQRAEHTATLLPNGTALVAGGGNGVTIEASAELYDPAEGTFSATGPMTERRFVHIATLLPDSRVLIAGGYNPDPSRLPASAELYFAELVVTIDIKPGDPNNTINLNSRATIQVAILSSADFDALTVDPASLTLTPAGGQASAHPAAGGAGAVTNNRGTPLTVLRDLDRDGRLDLVVHFRIEDLQLSPSDTEAVLRGTTFFGQRIRGVDSIRVVPPFVFTNRSERGQVPRKR